jgi:hypothetical protein
MNFDWTEYLNLAEVIYEQRKSLAQEEACMRTAISRGYYAAYGAACNFVETRKELELDHSGDNHGEVSTHFNRSPIKERKEIGTWLVRLRANRNKADYRNDMKENITAMTEVSLRKARELIILLNKL